MGKISKKAAVPAPSTAKLEVPAGPFTGFSNATFQFLRDLSDNQTRDWFLAHKADYEKAVREPMVSLVAALDVELSRRGIPLRGDVKRSVFRINRDIRFSKDKSPYKTHVSAALTRDGEKLSPGVLYVHVDPTGSFVAAGFHQPTPEALKAIRLRVASLPREFRRVLEELSSRGLKLSEDDGALKRVPRGFEQVQEPEVVDILRRNSLIVSNPLTQKAVKDTRLPETLATFAEASTPLLNFGWQAIEASSPR